MMYNLGSDDALHAIKYINLRIRDRSTKHITAWLVCIWSSWELSGLLVPLGVLLLELSVQLILLPVG